MIRGGIMKRTTGLVLLMLLAAGAGGAKEEEPKSHFAAGLDYAQVYFQDQVFKEVFRHDYLPGGKLIFTWYPVRNLGLTGEAGVFYASGFAVGKTGRRSGEKLQLYVIPTQLELNYRFDFLNEQVVVPWLSAGGDYWLYREENEFAKRVQGDKKGWHAGAGLGIQLDRLEPDSMNDLEQDFGVENVFLELGVQRTSMSRAGLDFSGWIYQAGLLFEF